MNREEDCQEFRAPGVLGYLSGAPRVTTKGAGEAGGPRSHVLGTIGGFTSLGWEVRPYIFGDRLHRRASKVESEKLLTSGTVMRVAADAARFGLGRLNRVKAWHEIGRVDWVYERLASFQALGSIFQRQGIPWIIESNGPFFYEARADRKAMVLTGIARRIELAAYRQSDIIVCVSEPLKQVIIDVSGVLQDKIVVLPNGVDTDFFNADDVDPIRLHDKPTVGFVGTLTDWQRLDLLIEAIAELRGDRLEVAATIVGDGLARKRWEQLASDLGVEDLVQFVGRVPREDVPAYIAGFDIGYSGPGLSGLGTMYHSPLKLYEYMAMSKPVLAADFEDARNLVRGKGTGFLFEPESRGSLRTKLEAVLDQRHVLQQMGVSARQEIVDLHSWETRVRTLVCEVDRILNL